MVHTRMRSDIPNGFNYPVRVHLCPVLNKPEMTVVDPYVERDCPQYQEKA